MEFRLWVQLWSRAVILTKYAGTCICDDVFPNAGKQSDLVQLWVHIFYILFISCKHSERSWSNCALILALTGLIFHLCCCHRPPQHHYRRRRKVRGTWIMEVWGIWHLPLSLPITQWFHASALRRLISLSVSRLLCYFVSSFVIETLARRIGHSFVSFTGDFTGFSSISFNGSIIYFPPFWPLENKIVTCLAAPPSVRLCECLLGFEH